MITGYLLLLTIGLFFNFSSGLLYENNADVVYLSLEYVLFTFLFQNMYEYIYNFVCHDQKCDY